MWSKKKVRSHCCLLRAGSRVAVLCSSSMSDWPGSACHASLMHQRVCYPKKIKLFGHEIDLSKLHEDEV